MCHVQRSAIITMNLLFSITFYDSRGIPADFTLTYLISFICLLAACYVIGMMLYIKIKSKTNPPLYCYVLVAMFGVIGISMFPDYPPVWTRGRDASGMLFIFSGAFGWLHGMIKHEKERVVTAGKPYKSRITLKGLVKFGLWLAVLAAVIIVLSTYAT